jgi:hypothetical protein
VSVGVFGWLLVCLDGCLGECWCVGALGNTNNELKKVIFPNEWKKINNEWKKSDFS